jgi:hypothetical protein
MAEPYSVLQARCSPQIAAAVARATRHQGATQSEYVRKAVLEALERDGISAAATDAGSLYDAVEGRQRFAWVEGGEIKAIAYEAEKPADDWLPVVHVDSEPFDIATHWRLAPVYSVEGERVVCTYPVVVKSLEYT